MMRSLPIALVCHRQRKAFCSVPGTAVVRPSRVFPCTGTLCLIVRSSVLARHPDHRRGAHDEQPANGAIALLADTPRCSLPPPLCDRGVRPSQAANCRPERNRIGSGTAAEIALAAIAPMPAMVRKRQLGAKADARGPCPADRCRGPRTQPSPDQGRRC